MKRTEKFSVMPMAARNIQERPINGQWKLRSIFLKMQEERDKLKGKLLSPREAGFDGLECYQILQIIK